MHDPAATYVGCGVLGSPPMASARIRNYATYTGPNVTGTLRIAYDGHSDALSIDGLVAGLS